MVDLTAKPFHLDDAAVAWVRSTIDAMTLEEKIQGKSAFQGTFNENVFCGSFDTRR